MASPKNSTVQFREKQDVVRDYYAICEEAGITPADPLRNFMRTFNTLHRHTLGGIKISVMSDKTSLSNDGNWCALSAKITGITVSEAELPLYFLLPEDKDSDAGLQWQIISTPGYQAIFPGSTGSRGQIIGARTVLDMTALEEGDVYYWQGRLFSDSEESTAEAEQAMHLALRRGLNDYLAALANKTGQSLPPDVLRIIRMPGQFCTVSITQPRSYDFGAWQVHIALDAATAAMISADEIGTLPLPRVRHRIFTPDGGYGAGLFDPDIDNFAIGFRIYHGISELHMYSNGIAEEENPHSPEEMAEVLIKLIDGRIQGYLDSPLMKGVRLR